MKKVIMFYALLGLMASPVLAGDNLDGGIKADLPYLIQLNDHNFIGLEASASDDRDLVFHQSLDNNDISAYIKYTYVGHFLKFGGS